MEVLLGRVEGFQSMIPFTIDTNNTAQPSGEMGNGTVLILNGGVAIREEGNGTTVSVSPAGKVPGREASFAALVVLLGVFMVW